MVEASGWNVDWKAGSSSVGSAAVQREPGTAASGVREEKPRTETRDQMDVALDGSV